MPISTRTSGPAPMTPRISRGPRHGPKLLAPGGVLATFSCSGAMTSELFDKILAEAAEDAGRDFQIVARTRQASDHPVALSFPEGLYLKGLILRSS